MKTKEAKKKVDEPVVQPEAVDEDKLPVINLEDCETFDPSAEKKESTLSDDEWEDDVSEQEDFSD